MVAHNMNGHVCLNSSHVRLSMMIFLEMLALKATSNDNFCVSSRCEIQWGHKIQTRKTKINSNSKHGRFGLGIVAFWMVMSITCNGTAWWNQPFKMASFALSKLYTTHFHICTNSLGYPELGFEMVWTIRNPKPKMADFENWKPATIRIANEFDIRAPTVSTKWSEQETKVSDDFIETKFFAFNIYIFIQCCQNISFLEEKYATRTLYLFTKSFVSQSSAKTTKIQWGSEFRTFKLEKRLN